MVKMNLDQQFLALFQRRTRALVLQHGRLVKAKRARRGAARQRTEIEDLCSAVQISNTRQSTQTVKRIINGEFPGAVK
jgi:hypothetical protein